MGKQGGGGHAGRGERVQEVAGDGDANHLRFKIVRMGIGQLYKGGNLFKFHKR